MAPAAHLALAGNQSPVPYQTHQLQRNRKRPNSPPPCHPPPAAVDVCVLIIALFACAYLVLPYIQLFYQGISLTFYAVKHDFVQASTTLKFVGIGIPVLGIAIFAIIRCTSSSRKCQNPNCTGLRDAPEFDVKIETQESVKNSSSSIGGGGMETGFFELTGDHNRKVEAQLKKVAPPNGRAILIFRASCGCPAGRMVVSGPKKTRKTKK